MKLSEEIMLGSLILTPKRYTFNDGEGHGCAIGMANAAVGFKNPIPVTYSGFMNQFEWSTFVERHPWVSMRQNCPVEVCCGCEAEVRDLIMHLFDFHEWSPAEIADWVRTIEPSEPVPANT